MHIAVLSNPESWYVADLVRAAGDRHLITTVSFSELASTIDSRGVGVSAGGVDLRTVDVVLVRTMPPGSLEQVVFRMDVLGRLEVSGVVVINSARAVEAAVDKYLATAKLQAAGLLVPRTIVCQTPQDALQAFDALGGDVVVKPLFGGEGRGITRASDEALALRAFKMLTELGAVVYLQEFVPHDGYDLRLLVIGPKVLGIRRRNPHDWRTNISRGATAEPCEVTPELAELAQRAAAALGARFCGVDLLPAEDGKFYAIEVNASPGWKATAAALGVDVARLLLDDLETLVRAAT